MPGNDLTDARYVSLATRRPSGELVPTPLWFAVRGDELVARTFERTGKVRRLRRDLRVELAPCDRRGDATGPYRPGVARFLAGEEAREANRLLARRYGWPKRLADLAYRPKLGPVLAFAVRPSPSGTA